MRSHDVLVGRRDLGTVSQLVDVRANVSDGVVERHQADRAVPPVTCFEVRDTEVCELRSHVLEVELVVGEGSLGVAGAGHGLGVHDHVVVRVELNDATLEREHDVLLAKLDVSEAESLFVRLS